MSIHKELSIAVINADTLASYGHAVQALVDLKLALAKYEELVVKLGVNRHAPTYNRACNLFYELEMVVEYEF